MKGSDPRGHERASRASGAGSAKELRFGDGEGPALKALSASLTEIGEKREED